MDFLFKKTKNNLSVALYVIVFFAAIFTALGISGIIQIDKASASIVFTSYVVAIVSPFVKTVIEKHISNGKSRDKITNEELEYYNFEKLKSNLISKYGQNVGFLVIKYGSSADSDLRRYDDSTPNDRDYLVLVYGQHYTSETKRKRIGSTKHSHDISDKGFDLQEVISDSFVLGLIIGRPYDISVAITGEIKDRYNVDSQYFKWYKQLAQNITIDVQTLIKQIREDTDDYKDHFKKFKNHEEYKKLVSICYLICSNYIKIYWLKKLNRETLSGPDIFPLSQSDDLSNQISNGRHRIFYKDLVDKFKNKEEPEDIHHFLSNYDLFVDHFQNKIK